jgi:alkylated DNA nucleotide flippase Atl1
MAGDSLPGHLRGMRSGQLSTSPSASHGRFLLRSAYSSSVTSDRYARILQRVRDTPAGFVRTYGDVSPGAPRVAGAVLHECDDPSVPWHRIVRSDGSLTQGERQRLILEREGVPFRGERVDIRKVRLPT